MAGSARTMLLSLALGDAVGLPLEGLSPRRAARLFPPPHRPRLILGRGLLSDDTEHACMTAQALIASAGEPARFRRDLARRLRWWLASAPAGVGLATAKSILKLWAGVPPQRSGVWSAGNGPAMRAPVVGAFARDTDELVALTTAATVLTHRDPRALHGAIAVALAAHHARGHGHIDAGRFREELGRLLPADSALLSPVDRAISMLDRPTAALASEMGLGRRGVSGYILHTAPVALHAALRHGADVRATVSAVLECGGDTDTVAAVAGAISGSGATESDLPRDWLAGLRDWPRTTPWITRLGDQLDRVAQTSEPERPASLPPLATVPRNAVFLAVVLGHGFRRLLPPY